MSDMLLSEELPLVKVEWQEEVSPHDHVSVEDDIKSQ
jgi:hypothetical protein